MKKFNEFLKEEKDDGEYGQQGGMAKSQLRMIMSAAKRLHDSLKDDDSLPGHIIANIVLATDYVTGSADYMESEMNDEGDEGDEEEEDDYEDNYEMDDMDEGLYHVSYGTGLDHQVVAKDAMDAHKKAMAHFKKTKPKLNDPKYADTFDKKSITRVKGDEPRSDKYKTEEVEGSVKRNREMLATGRISKDEFDRRMGYGKYKKGQPAGVGPLGKSLYKNLTKSMVEKKPGKETEK